MQQLNIKQLVDTQFCYIEVSILLLLTNIITSQIILRIIFLIFVLMSSQYYKQKNYG